MSEWDVATWAQVVIAAVGLVVAAAASAVAWFTYRFTIDSQPIDFKFERSNRPVPEGVIPMHLTCKSPQAFLHQVWSPDWKGGDRESAPEVVGIEAQEMSQGDVRMFNVILPEGVTSFELVATASVDKRGRLRNVWSGENVMAFRSNV